MTPVYDPVQKVYIDAETGLTLPPGTALGNGQVVPRTGPGATGEAEIAPRPSAATLPAAPPAAPATVPTTPATATTPTAPAASTESPTPASGPQPVAARSDEDPDVVTARQATGVADAGVAAAKAAYTAAQARYDEAVKSSIDPVTGKPSIVPSPAVTEQIKAAGTLVDTAYRGIATATTAQANAYDRVSIAAIQAAARSDRDPALKAHYEQLDAQSRSQSALYDKQAQGYLLKNDSDIAVNKAQIDKLSADAVNTGALTQPTVDRLNAEAGNLQAQSRRSDALLSTDVAQGQAKVGETNAQTGLLGAQTTASQAQATLSGAQANLTQAQADLANATLPADKAAAQLKVDTAQQQLDQARKLLPGVVAQQGATLAGTEAQTAGQQATTAATQGTTLKGQQGAQYGLEQKISQIKALRASGQINDQEAEQMWAQAKAQAVGGPTPYEAQQQATTQRGQDTQLAGTQTSTLGSLGSSVLSSMLASNKDAPAGSNAMAQSYGGVMGALYNAMKGLTPQQTPAMLAALQGGPLAAAANAPMQQTPTVQNASNVTANAANVVHAAVSAALGNPTGSTDSQPVAPNALNAAQYGANPLAPGQLPGMLAGQQLGTPDHVDQLWAGSGIGAYASGLPGQRGNLNPVQGASY